VPGPFFAWTGLLRPVLAEAQDGYQVLFSLGELDPSFIDDEILLADTANGKPLFGALGQFRLVVPKDEPAARSVRMLTKLEVVQFEEVAVASLGLLQHHFGRLDDDRDLVSLLETKLFRATARDHTLDLAFPDFDDEVGHDVP
jgi:hypothetical protein